MQSLRSSHDLVKDFWSELQSCTVKTDHICPTWKTSKLRWWVTCNHKRTSVGGNYITRSTVKIIDQLWAERVSLVPPIEKVTRKMDECVLSVNCLGLQGQILFRARTKQASCSVCVNLCMCDGMFCVFTWLHVVLCVPCVCLTSGGVKKGSQNCIPWQI